MKRLDSNLPSHRLLTYWFNKYKLIRNRVVLSTFRTIFLIWKWCSKAQTECFKWFRQTLFWRNYNFEFSFQSHRGTYSDTFSRDPPKKVDYLKLFLLLLFVKQLFWSDSKQFLTQTGITSLTLHNFSHFTHNLRTYHFVTFVLFYLRLFKEGKPYWALPYILWSWIILTNNLEWNFFILVYISTHRHCFKFQFQENKFEETNIRR